MLNKIKKSLKESTLIRIFYFGLFFWPIYFLSGLVKKDKKLWLIASPHGFSDNTKYFYIFYKQYLKEKYDISLIWIAQTKEEKNYLSEIGFNDSELRKSVKGIFLFFKSKVCITSHGVAGTNDFLLKNTFIVSLWHGIGIKNMLFKSTVELGKIKAKNNKLIKFIFPHLNKKYDLFLSTSELMTDHFAECFAMDKKSFFISEYPRCKLLIMQENNLDNFIEKYETSKTKKLTKNFKSYKKVFIYMPTWRDANPSFLTSSGIQWQKINEILMKNNFLLLLKAHPNSDISSVSSFSNINILNPKLDIYPILLYTDCLITDYSSIYFDYLLTSKNIALFTFDYDEYMKNCRDFAYPYDENMIGYKINDFNEFITFFENYEKIDFSIFDDKIENIKNRFWTQDVDLDDFVETIVNKVRLK